MIQISDLSFGYNKKKLLYSPLNLTLEKGGIYGLLGKNGAGKSTLLKLLTGMLFPTKGRIEVNGFKPKERNPQFLEEVFFIPEEVEVPPISIKKYLSLNACFYPRFNESQFYSCLEDLEVMKEGKLSDLSFGQQKKFVIAFALACNTKLLILDEPTNGLDIPSKSWFRKHVSLSVNEDKIIVISTHQVRDLDNLIDSVLILDNGELLVQHTLTEIGSKLVFKTETELPENPDYIYAEQSLKGHHYIAINTKDEDSRIDLELLFEASIHAPEKIKSIFNKN